MSSVVVIISGCHGQVLVARGAVQELQRGAEGHEGARDRLAGRVGRRRRCHRGRQGDDAGHVDCSESRGRVRGRAVLRRVSLALKIHRGELLPGLLPCLQVTRSGR